MLRGLGLDFSVRPPSIDETPRDDESPSEYVLRLAAEKAQAEVGADEMVLAADTTVVVDGELLGKPDDQDEACRMLQRLSGRWHEVLTGVALYDSRRDVLLSATVTTRVLFTRLAAAEIEWYVASGEPLDKAGAYGVQGLGALFVEAIDGNYSNVVGLPLPCLYRLLRWLGFSALGPAVDEGSTAEFDRIPERVE